MLRFRGFHVARSLACPLFVGSFRTLHHSTFVPSCKICIATPTRVCNCTRSISSLYNTISFCISSNQNKIQASARGLAKMLVIQGRSSGASHLLWLNLTSVLIVLEITSCSCVWYHETPCSHSNRLLLLIDSMEGLVSYAQSSRVKLCPHRFVSAQEQCENLVLEKIHRAARTRGRQAKCLE